MEGQEQKKMGVTSIVVILLILAVIGYGIFKYIKKDSSGDAMRNENGEMVENGDAMKNDEQDNGQTGQTFQYKSGVYSATGNYISPGGAEEIGVTLTIQNDIIVAAVVEPRATRPISVEKQADFTANFKTQVIGKKLDEVSLDKVSGSSLTPDGFNDAVSKIKIEAQV